MLDFLANNADKIGSFFGALIGGIIGGGLAFRFSVTRSTHASGAGMNVDQSKSQAGGDIVGGHKTTTSVRQ